MRPVERPSIPILVESGPHRGSLQALVQALRQYLELLIQRVNGTLPKDGSEAMTGPMRPGAYTVATRPAAADWPGGIIYVSDAAAGAKYQGSDGAAWVNLG